MNWKRSIIKENAKVSLKNRYWFSYAVSIVAFMLAGGICNMIWTVYSYPAWENMIRHFRQLIEYETYYGEIDGFGSFSQPDFFTAMAIYHDFPYIAIFSLLTILLGIFVGAAMRVGSCRYYVRKRFGNTNFNSLFSGFQEKWGNTIIVTFLTKLFCVLWGLLFVIPGIVKKYQYYYVDFLLSDNPDLSGTRARQISRMLSDGEKGQLFIFDLSFIGWSLLVALTSFLTFGLSFTFLTPYVASARAELYIFVRNRAIDAGQLNSGGIKSEHFSPSTGRTCLLTCIKV